MKVKATKTANSKILLKNIPKFHYNSEQRDQFNNQLSDITYSNPQEGSIYYQLQLSIQQQRQLTQSSTKQVKIYPIQFNNDHSISPPLKTQSIKKPKHKTVTQSYTQTQNKKQKTKLSSSKTLTKKKSAKTKRASQKLMNSQNTQNTSINSITTNDALTLNEKFQQIHDLSNQLDDNQFSHKGMELISIMREDISLIQGVIKHKLKNHDLLSKIEDTQRLVLSNTEVLEEDSSSLLSDETNQQNENIIKHENISQDQIDEQIKSVLKELIIQTISELSIESQQQRESQQQKINTSNKRTSQQDVIDHLLDDNSEFIDEEVHQQIISSKHINKDSDMIFSQQSRLQKTIDTYDSDSQLIISKIIKGQQNTENILNEEEQIEEDLQHENSVKVIDKFEKQYQVNSSIKLDYAKLQQLEEGKYSPLFQENKAQSFQKDKSLISSNTLIIRIDDNQHTKSQVLLQTKEITTPIECSSDSDLIQNSIFENQQNIENSIDEEILNSVNQEQQFDEACITSDVQNTGNIIDTIDEIRQFEAPVEIENPQNEQFLAVESAFDRNLADAFSLGLQSIGDILCEEVDAELAVQSVQEVVQEDVEGALVEDFVDQIEEKLPVEQVAEEQNLEENTEKQNSEQIDEHSEELVTENVINELPVQVASPDYVFDDEAIDDQLDLLTSSGPVIDLNNIEQQIVDSQFESKLSSADKKILQKVVDINDYKFEYQQNNVDDNSAFYVPDKLFTTIKIQKIVQQFLEFIENYKESTLSIQYFSDKAFLVDSIISQAQQLGLFIKVFEETINTIQQLKDNIDYGNENHIIWSKNYEPVQKTIISQLINLSRERQWFYSAFKSPVENIEKLVQVTQQEQFNTLDQISSLALDEMINQVCLEIFSDL